MKRRDILNKAAISVAAGSGMTSIAAAENPSVDPQTVRQELAQHSDLLQELVDDGVLPHPGLGQFDLTTYAKPGATDEGVSITQARNVKTGETTPVYTVNHETEEGFVHIRVRPEFDFATAKHNIGDDKTTYGFLSENDTEDDVSIQSDCCPDPCKEGVFYKCVDEYDCETCCCIWCERCCCPNNCYC